MPRPFDGRDADAGDPPVDDLDVALDERAVDERGFDAEPHRLERRSDVAACRSQPRACGCRVHVRRAAMTIATFALPSAAASASSASLARCARRGHDDPQHPGAQLLVRRVDVDHEVVERLAEPDHRDRRDHVQDELLRRARLQPRRAGEDLGADDDGDLVLDRPAELRARGADDAGGRGAGGRGRLDRAEHVRRPAAGADPDHGVGRSDPDACSVAPARLGVVLGRLLLERRRCVGAGQEGEHLAGLGGERRLAFGRVHLREPAGRAGADVDETAAGLQALDDGLHDGGDVCGRGGNGRRHRSVVLVHRARRARRWSEDRGRGSPRSGLR